MLLTYTIEMTGDLNMDRHAEDAEDCATGLKST